MIYIYWLVGLTLGSWLVISPWFFALTRLKNMGYSVSSFGEFIAGFRRLMNELGWIVSVPLVIFLPLGALADIVFNLTWGSVIFRELPREAFYTSRVKRHAKKGDAKGLRWKSIINAIQPGHV